MSFVVVLPQKRQITDIDTSKYLTLREQEIFRYFKNVSKAYMWFLERVATKKAIQLYLERTRKVNVPWNLIDISQNESGAPSFKIIKGHFRKEEENTSISLGHIKNIAIGGVSHKKNEGCLGVRVEKVRNFKQFFLRAFLGKDEIKEVNHFKTPYRRKESATLFWSIKEAYLKSVGQNTSPKNILVKKICKGSYEIYNIFNLKIPVGFARGWTPQTGFIAIEVYIR